MRIIRNTNRLATMSMREYSTIMKEAGLTSGTGSSEKFQVEHVFLLRMDENLEKLIAKLVDTALLLSLQFLRTLKVLTYASAGFMLLYGSSKLITSIKKEADGRPSPKEI